MKQETFHLSEEEVEKVSEAVESDDKIDNKAQFYRFAVRQELQAEET